MMQYRGARIRRVPRGRLRIGVAAAAVVMVAGVGVSAAAVDSGRMVAADDGSIRIEVGGSGFVDMAGHEWKADEGFTGGVRQITDAEINGTWDQKLFRTQRSKMTAYEVDAKDGNYNLRLYFAGIEADTGAFGVSAEGKEIIKDYDIAKTVGYNTVDIQQFPITVTGGKLDLSFSGEKPSLAGIELISTPKSSNIQLGTVPIIKLGDTPVTKPTVAPDSAVSVMPVPLVPITPPAFEKAKVKTANQDGTSAYRMHASTSTSVTPDGLTWRADTGTGGTIESTKLDGSPIFVGVREGAREYHQPTLNGKYVLEMSFAADSEHFDAKVEGNEVITDYTKAEDGSDTVTMTVPITITDGVLDIVFESDEDATPSLAGFEMIMPDYGVTKTSDKGKEAKACTLEALIIDGKPASESTDFAQPIHKNDDCEWVDGNGEPIMDQLVAADDEVTTSNHDPSQGRWNWR